MKLVYLIFLAVVSTLFASVGQTSCGSTVSISGRVIPSPCNSPYNDYGPPDRPFNVHFRRTYNNYAPDRDYNNYPPGRGYNNYPPGRGYNNYPPGRVTNNYPTEESSDRVYPPERAHFPPDKAYNNYVTGSGTCSCCQRPSCDCDKCQRQ